LTKNASEIIWLIRASPELTEGAHYALPDSITRYGEERKRVEGGEGRRRKEREKREGKGKEIEGITTC
jgi:hypothetical protein